MQDNRLPQAAGLLDTLSESRDMIKLKFSNNKVDVMVLALRFAEENPYHLLEWQSRMVTLGESAIPSIVE